MLTIRKNITGITPADAGKTAFIKISNIIEWDHPRGCGENPYTGTVLTGQLGSPPRMRGKPALKTAATREKPDHPRGCGENTGANAQKIAQ